MRFIYGIVIVALLLLQTVCALQTGDSDSSDSQEGPSVPVFSPQVPDSQDSAPNQPSFQGMRHPDSLKGLGK